MRRRGVFRLSAVALAAVLTAGMTGVTTGPADAAAIGWTGTWAVSPQSGSTVFNQQTVRQIVHTSIGGTSARVQLSNAFGRQPVTIDNVHVARRTSDSGVDLGTDRVATFGGQRSVTIPAGSLAVSDAIDLVVPAQSDLAVSIYLPQATGPATYHQTSSQTNYVTSGNASANATLPGAQQVGSYYFLANLDVQNASAPGAVATLGASITDGVGSSSNTNRRWPNRLASRLVDSGRAVGVLNQGISGNKLLADGAGQSAPNRFERDVLAQPGVKWVIFSDDPINDLGVASPPAASQLIDAAKQLISRAHQRNIKFICSTLTPSAARAAGRRRPRTSVSPTTPSSAAPTAAVTPCSTRTWRPGTRPIPRCSSPPTTPATTCTPTRPVCRPSRTRSTSAGSGHRARRSPRWSACAPRPTAATSPPPAARP